jgi:hypothetical protein
MQRRMNFLEDDAVHSGIMETTVRDSNGSLHCDPLPRALQRIFGYLCCNSLSQELLILFNPPCKESITRHLYAYTGAIRSTPRCIDSTSFKIEQELLAP